MTLASGVDADWLDVSWGERSTGAIGRVRCILFNRPGTLAEVRITGAHANSLSSRLVEAANRDPGPPLEASA